MSMGLYDIVGESYYVETPQTKQWYDNNGYGRGAITQDVLENVIDPFVDFSLYDNWTRTSNYNHDNAPDDVVDMIFMIWRGSPFFSTASGEAKLGGTNFLTDDGVWVKGSWPTGSGITIEYEYDYGSRDVFKVAIHEFAHWLIGPHPYGGSDRHRIWGLAADRFADGDCANAFERHQLAWINVIDVTDVNAPLDDFVTSGVAYRYHPPNGSPDEYYYFENHQKVHATSDNPTTYDDATKNSNDKGIFVLHSKGAYNGTNNIRCKISDGQYDWENPFWVPNCWGGGNLPAFREVSANADAENRCDALLTSQGNRDWLHNLADENDNSVCAAFFRGEQSTFSFSNTTNDVLTPWSNPHTNTWQNNHNTNFGMEVLNQTGNVINVHFYLSNPAAAKPSKPQNLVLKYYKHKHGFQIWMHPNLVWDTNSEPDLIKYKVYRNSSKKAEVTHDPAKTTHSWVDHSVDMDGGPIALDYAITAVDQDAYESLPSGEVTAYTTWPSKILVDSQNLPKQYDLSQNHPNPFNPVTTIKYVLPEESFVTLKLYNLMGHEIAMLVSGTVEAGYQNVIWEGNDSNGNPVSSGMYLYRLDAISRETEKEFHMTRKMVLLQ